jgi:hypothetical protein
MLFICEKLKGLPRQSKYRTGALRAARRCAYSATCAVRELSITTDVVVLVGRLLQYFFQRPEDVLVAAGRNQNTDARISGNG